MAKRKKTKSVKKGFEYSAELYGVLLVLAAILGIGKYGPIGKLIASFGIFLVGSGYGIFLVVLFIVGVYLVIKREWPDFFNTKLIGIYMLTIGLLVLMHREYVVANEGNIGLIFQATLDELVTAFNNIMTTGTVNSIFELGGGIVGGAFAVVFDQLFSLTGMQIVCWVLIAAGLSLFTGFSVFDAIRNGYENHKQKVANKPEEPKEDKEPKKSLFARLGQEKTSEEPKKSPVIISNGDEEEEDKEGQKPIVISSIDKLPGVKDNNVEHSEVEQTEEEHSAQPETVSSNYNKNYKLPPLELLNKPKKKGKNANQSAIEKNIVTLENVLKDFGVIGKVVEVHVGPTVTQYELEIKSGTKLSKIISLNREIALVLAKKDVRIEAPIPGKNTVGIEIPNEEAVPVTFREVLEKIPASKQDSKLLVPLGKNIMGNVVWCEINKTPHLLVAGATGAGKSVCINGIICSILMRARPDEVKLMMVDPKKVELSLYNGIPHLMCPVVTNPKKASIALGKIVSEMERRYDMFEETKTKNIGTYNAYIDEKNKHLPDDEKLKRMPFIVVIVDELADLMVVAAKDVESSIMRITQMARAAGIHLIIATQRPSTDVITGVVKANIPSRIAFTVSSSIDSRTILDSTGAEKLLGKGDMLFLPMGEATSQRVQGAFIADEEIKRIIDHTVEQQKAEYDQALMNLEEEAPSSDKSASQIEDAKQKEEYDDPLYNDIVEFVIETQKASASLLQRRFKLGYNRAARIIDLLEERGIIGPANGSKPRVVLVKLEDETPNE